MLSRVNSPPVKLGRMWRILLLFALSFTAVVQCKRPSRNSDESNGNGNGNGNGERGLFPSVVNLATEAEIRVNATCGESGPEVYCKLVEHVFMRSPQCGICDAQASDPQLRHPITNAIDGTNSWWQSPSLQNGRRYEWITITLDLKQVFQVAYVIVKAAISPRPGNWILERSIDGVNFSAWQYYAINDGECLTKYGIEPREGKPTYRSDSEVICTSFYSKLNPLEDGEIHTSLVNGRPGSSLPSAELLEFTRARYVRLRLQKIRTLNADLMSLSSGRNMPAVGSQNGSVPEKDRSIFRRLFYSIKDISIGGQCVCFGHASKCTPDSDTGRSKCQCEHNTCGDSCEKCCPLYNQVSWRPGTSTDGAVCEKCQCHGHAQSCYYDPQVEIQKRSLDTEGQYRGGGVCVNCTAFTTGINCEQCIDGYYRPKGVSPDASRPCIPCNCDPVGSVGFCTKDDSGELAPGTCTCRRGFTGPLCNKCAKGYRGYPNCEPCPCNVAGITDPECRVPCQCKVNVEGPRCDRCKSGYFDLNEKNPEGCTQCFCFDRSGRCTLADLGIDKITSKDGWLISDLQGRRVVTPFLEDDKLLIANDDMADYESYYWLAPQDYVGKKLTSYAQRLKFRVSWVTARGDTGGRATKSPDIVLEGSGMRIAYGERSYRHTNATITLDLKENGWYHLLHNVQDITRKRRTEYKGDPVSRSQLMRVLNNVERFMIRAKYHTDQIEGVLHEIELDAGSENSLSKEKVHGIEQCSCPPGYTGLSCEQCDFGYIRIGGDGRSLGECKKCNCHGHAATCDVDTGQCGECQHNTVGPKCESCAPGYFGDARTEAADACKKCRCPLEIPSNNFSPTCVSAANGQDHICDACPAGYEGRHCERCADGYYGNPLVPGSYCQPCDCNNNQQVGVSDWCDRLTGICLKCRPGITGPNCDKCAEGFFGDPINGDCRPCSCNSHGSLANSCDPVTGQCQCRDKYTGRSCDRCKDGYGNVAAGCRNCNCDPAGSVRTDYCSPESGQCECKPGVGGLTCNQCIEEHYGLSHNGCQGCVCSEIGSVGRSCDIVTGQCQCRPNVVGRDCDQCQEGFWNLQSRKGCQPCLCDPLGSFNETCDPVNGRCPCKPGITGKLCDSCSPGFFGFSATGCKRCDPCDKPGHVCDPDTGRCVCPPFTEGSACERCSSGSWAYDPVKGCKSCNCRPEGSRSTQCDERSGQCSCREGYEGPLCDRCQFGYYGFPQCRKCNCNIEGTDPSVCDLNGLCQCANDGQCPCRANVMGAKCDRCKENTFGLQQENEFGCTQCFCFTRITTCAQANYVWTQLRGQTSGRTLRINYDHPLRPPNAVSANQFPVNTQEICYINLAVPGQRELKFKPGETRLNITNNLRIVPGTTGDVMIGVSQMFDTPVYWRLPEIFLKDKVASYNGYLRFTVTSDGGSTILPANILATYPLVQIQGNNRVILEYFPTQPSPTGRYEVRLHENQWKVRNNPRQRATREMLMVALQNLQHILVRATDSMDRSRAELTDVSLDYAVPAAGASQWSHLNVAKGVELCQCPLGYNGTSCQDPSIGFYRYYKSDHVSSTVIIDLVGEAAPCQCNGRSETCHKETGICSNCRENTAGPRCDICAPGYFGDPNRDGCRPCACPTPDRNFAESCEVSSSGYQKCSCKKGYRGERCERCEYGYYGNPLAPGGQCQPCNCVSDGSVSDECDEITGQCNCKPGITGRDCSSCAPRHVITSSGCSSCESGCTGILFQDIDAMTRSIQHLNFSNYVPVPWTGLFDHENQTAALEMELKKHVEDNDLAQRLAQTPNLIPLAQITLERVKELENEALKVVPDLLELKPEAHAVEEEIRTIRRNCEDVIAHMKNYAIGETSSINIHKAVAEAEGHLKFILSLDFRTSEAVAQKELERARNLVLSVKNLFHDVGELDQVRDKLEGIRFRMEDLETQIRKSQDTTNQALKTIAAGNASLAGARSPVGLITEFSSKTDTRNTAARKLNANATNALKEARSNYQDLRISLESLRNRTNQCEIKTERLSRLNPEYRSRFVIPAQEHANNLWNQAQDLFNQFNETRDVADLPLQAANAYKGIVDALRDAEKAAGDATDAADTAYEEAYPDDLDLSLLEQARLSRKKSQDFLEQSEKLRNSVLEHGEKLKGERGLLENVEKILEQVRSSHSESILLLNNLPKVRDRAKAAVDKSTDAFTKTLATSRRVVNTSALVESDLKARLLALQTGRSVGYGDAPSLIEESRKNSKIIDSKISHLTKKSFELRSMNSSISVKLDELRRKIMRAKQAASSIRVSLSGKDGSCVRTYKPPLQPGSMSSIVIHYAIYGKEKNSMLFYLPASKKHGTDPQADFLAVEMVDRKIRFVWNVGGGVQSITNPHEILPSPEDLSDDSRWYRIEAERIGNIGTLTVRPMKGDDSILSNSGTTVSGASPARFTKLDLMSGDRLYIGGLPKNSSADLKSKKLAGCIHQVWLDGQPIGLWNFETSTKCNACIEGAQEAEDESSFHFRGNGYSELPQIPRYDSRQYSVTFSFRTFDENALLFLAINDTLGQYVSLELVGGVLRYEVRYGLQHELSLQSRNKYNNGQWTKVEASRVLLRGVETALLKVDDEELSAAPFNSEVPDLDLEIAKLYVGGIPPDVQIPQQLMPSLPGSFLGCMKDLQVVAFGLNPLQGSYYGVEASCPSKSQRSVAFSGRGFVELKTPAWRKDGTFGVSFKSSQPDGILLVSTNSAGDMQSDSSAASSEDANDNLVSMALRDRDPDSFSIALRHGKLEIRSRSGLSGETASVVSSDSYNDGLFHTVVIIRSGRKMDILVDDANIGTIRLPKAAGSSSGGAAEHSVLFLGGTRTDFNAADLLGTTQSLEGCIADIMLNNELLGLDNPVRFKDAAIGRCDNVPAPRVIEERMQANEIALSRCREVPQYTIEGRAVKFGDAPNSHVIISTNRKELHSVFNITLDFRTFYPNGLLLFSSLKKKKIVNMLMVALKNGRVVVSLHGRRKQDITSVDNLNDGKWHKIHVVKDKRKISLFVDGMPPTRSKAPNAIQVDGQLFVGGLSDASQIIENMVVDGFKGCIRNLNLNGRTQDLASGKNVVQRVGQCFAHVERGSYFPGDAYAVYSEDFRVGAMADIELEFRTTEMNGVLLSVSELRGSPALSLSIEEGVVIMAVDMGDNHTFSVRQRFTTPYHICDNRWHSIKASYVENALTLKVDNMDQQYGFSTNGEVRETKTKSPLYIGGLPDGAPRGTLQIRDNFKGCIRNLVIRGDFRDWTDMSRLNNVLLNACPIQ